MSKKSFIASVLFATVIYLPATQVYGWGEEGHNAICATAAHLVQNSQLQRFLHERVEIMGHICNLPDISWRDQENTKDGDSAHFMNPQHLGYSIEQVPVDLETIFARFQGKPSPVDASHVIDVPEDLGSSWWRADQFYDRALYFARAAIRENTKRPSGSTNPTSDWSSFPVELQPVGRLATMDPVTYSLYGMVTNLGLMGHFVGDASQPLHNDANYDGWDNGHGGIHSYYETAVVDELSFGPDTLNQNAAPSVDLRTQVYNKAQALLKDAGAGAVLNQMLAPGLSVVERMKALSTYSAAQVAELYAKDKVLEPSRLEVSADGKVKKTYAKRLPAAQTAATFKDMIVEQMAYSALTLAKIWDDVAEKAGNVPYYKYHSYLYPLDVIYVHPDYLTGKRTPLNPAN